MTAAEFAARAVGIPWRRWASSWDAADCWGLAVLFFREVHGLDLGAVPRIDIGEGFERCAADWPRCEPLPGACAFMAWQDGRPAHCGVLIDVGHVLHSPGADDHPATARVTPLAAMRRLYGDITFHRYAPRC